MFLMSGRDGHRSLKVGIVSETIGMNVLRIFRMVQIMIHWPTMHSDAEIIIFLAKYKSRANIFH